MKESHRRRRHENNVMAIHARSEAFASAIAHISVNSSPTVQDCNAYASILVNSNSLEDCITTPPEPASDSANAVALETDGKG